MADNIVELFISGTQNVVDAENIKKDASQDSENWITQDGRLKLSYGRYLVGAEGTAGSIQGLHWAYKVDGTKVGYRKTATKIQYLNGTTWTDVITGLTSGADYSFANYSSLAGAFVFIGGIDGLYKINTANPASYLSLYDSTENDKGRIMIDKGRLIMWDCVNASKTTLKLSYIDSQDSDVYTTVTGESIGTGSATYTGTLAAKTATRNIFGLSFTGTTGGTPETFTDNKDGTLTSNKAGTGTINYTTGVYAVTFSATATSVTADYQWEDSTEKGLADFTFSATRVAGEGNRITQDIGGDKILNVLVGQDGAYYSLKEQSAYRLEISADDATFTNLVYRRDIGITNWRSAISTSKGIVFMNTANPDKPELTILQRNPLGDNIEPVSLFNHYKFSNFDYTDCSIDTWERYVVVSCREEGTQINNVILLCDMQTGIVDKSTYGARMFAKNAGVLYIGSPITESVYKIFNGFDDDGSVIENYWIGKDETYDSERLKKFRRLRIMGNITPEQSFDVYISYDGNNFESVGTISGSGEYVDTATPAIIGSNMVGEVQIGGEDSVDVSTYPYFREIKLNPPKFRKRTIKIIATGIGYVDIAAIMDWDILGFENRIPKKYRVKDA